MQKNVPKNFQTPNDPCNGDDSQSNSEFDSYDEIEDYSDDEKSFLLRKPSVISGMPLTGTFREAFGDQDEKKDQSQEEDSVGKDSSESGIVQPSSSNVSGYKKRHRVRGQHGSISVHENNKGETFTCFTPPTTYILNGISKPAEEDDSTLPYKDCLLQILHVLRFKSEELDKLLCINSQRYPESSQIIFNPNRTIFYASFSQLIIALTNPSATDINFQNSFLISFPSFAEPRVFLAALFLRFFINTNYPKANITSLDNYQLMRNRVIRILSKWMDSFPYHFTTKMINAIEEFLKLIDDEQNLKLQKQIMIKSLQRVCGKSKSLIRRVSESPPLILPTDIPENEWTLTDIPPQELARQITLLHSKYYTEVKPGEILASIWGEKISCGFKNFSKLIQHFNSFSNNVSISILVPASPHVRAKLFSFWIDVAYNCYKLNNFHGMFSIISGLIHPSVKRLKETIGFTFRTFSKRKSYFQEMENICDISNDFENYRNVFKNVAGPCVPFIGCFQKDLIYIQETYDDNIKGLINFKKCDECVKIYEKIAKYQSEKYNFTEHPTIQILITDIPIEIDMKVLMNVSIRREPKKNHVN